MPYKTGLGESEKARTKPSDNTAWQGKVDAAGEKDVAIVVVVERCMPGLNDLADDSCGQALKAG